MTPAERGAAVAALARLLLEAADALPKAACMFRDHAGEGFL